jgi:hypothetical protein
MTNNALNQPRDAMPCPNFSQADLKSAVIGNNTRKKGEGH